MEKSGAFVRLHVLLSLLRIFLLINETDRGSGFLLGDAASLSRCPVTVLRTQFLKVYREKCFEFVIDHETYWDNADKDCRLRGGHLATIGDKETQAFIMETLRSIGFNKHGLWIGLNDREHEQRWVWATGENLGSYRNWAAQQGNGITHLTDDCVHLRYIDGGLWHDSPCHLGTYHYTYICQYQMIPTTTSRTSVRTSPSTTATKSTASPATASKTTSSPSPTSQTMKRTATATATSTLSSTTSPTTTTTTTTTTTLSTRISPTTVSKSTANPISTTTAATKATTSIASSSTITTLITSSTTIPTETTKSTTIDQTLTQATTEAVDAKTISSTSTSQPATITTTLPMTSTTLSATTFLTVTTPDPPITSTPTSTTDERKTPEPFKTISPCQPLICGLDCGIFGFVYANDGCPICACAS